jgi:hypothetical protein
VNRGLEGLLSLLSALFPARADGGSILCTFKVNAYGRVERGRYFLEKRCRRVAPSRFNTAEHALGDARFGGELLLRESCLDASIPNLGADAAGEGLPWSLG